MTAVFVPVKLCGDSFALRQFYLLLYESFSLWREIARATVRAGVELVDLVMSNLV